MVDFDSLIESLYEYPEIDKKSHAGGKDDSNNNDIEDYDSALRHLIEDLRVMKKNAQHQDSFDGLRVMKRNAQEPFNDLRVMRRNAQENLDGLRVMKKSAQEPAKGKSRRQNCEVFKFNFNFNTCLHCNQAFKILSVSLVYKLLPASFYCTIFCSNWHSNCSNVLDLL